ncbi:TIGR04219 family outer membrane beta-barrel protein [Idiomarina xiamenensis]|uniref:Outer membrane protein n=1 Tax=Idiomarina xiamenensis 10-D-4 TaxID=740709 RepID=K2JVI6_9GAMM|nr:TIGR04219 family outer membrane beta-barrel protein [Idiomarina xiamenensis]EKE87436.1 hypothetical protein A10D4_00030 [Idiomarina xiamenensis 10-D-4]
MKKGVLTACSLLAMLGVSFSSQADSVLGIYAGARYHDLSVDGELGQSNGVTHFDFSDDQPSSFYIALEHPLPLLPNIKISSFDMSTKSDIQVEQGTWQYGGVEYPQGSTANVGFDVDFIDYTFYYEILDNDLVSVDFGLTARDLDGHTSSYTGQDAAPITQQFSGILPMLYTQVRVGIPTTPITLFADANYLSFKDSDARDIQAGIEYRLIDNITVDVNLQAGYRDMKLALDDLDNINTDINFKGWFAGIEVHF